MPNWCDNSIAFYQEDGGKAMLEAFYADIQKYQDYKDPETGESSDWVGHWLESSKIDINKLSTRGFFGDCELNEDHVCINMATAWSPLPEVWDLMAEKYELSYVYISEEPGNEAYVNTDSEGRFFTTRYMLQNFDVDDLELDVDTLTEFGDRLREFNDEPLYFDSWEEVAEEFEAFGFNVTDLESLNKRLEAFNIEVYEYDYE